MICQLNEEFLSPRCNLTMPVQPLPSQPRIIDLSVPLSDQSASEPFPASIRYVDHAEGASQMESLFGITAADLVYSQGGGWAIEEIQAKFLDCSSLALPTGAANELPELLTNLEDSGHPSRMADLLRGDSPEFSRVTGSTSGLAD